MPIERRSRFRDAMRVDVGLRSKQTQRPTGDPPGDQVRVFRPGIAHRDVGLALGQAEDLRRGVQLHSHVRVLLMQTGDGRDQEVDRQ
ncbi:hypothetical protein D3C72_309560 [compost metagenome]